MKHQHSGGRSGGSRDMEPRPAGAHTLMPQSFYCSDCVVNWSPAQTRGGACPACGAGTMRRQDPVSDDAAARYQAVTAAEWRAMCHSQFEEFYAAREAKRIAGLERGDTE